MSDPLVLTIISEKMGICPGCESYVTIFYGTIKDTIRIKEHDIKVTSKISRCLPEGHEFALPEDEQAAWKEAYQEYLKVTQSV